MDPGELCYETILNHIPTTTATGLQVSADAEFASIALERHDTQPPRKLHHLSSALSRQSTNHSAEHL